MTENALKPYVIGLDLGGTNSVFGIVDARGEIKATTAIKTGGYDNVNDYVKAAVEALQPIIETVGGIEKIKAMGIGAPNGNFYKGTIEYAPNLPWAHTCVVPLADLFSKALGGLPVALTNDANAAALGEMTYGAARGLKNFIDITLADYIRGYVKANQVNDYLELIKKSKELCTIPIIASINCYKADAWIDFARQIELAGADALELNVFFMETELTEDFESIRDTYVSIIRKVKETVSIPVIMKIGKNYSNIPSLVNLLKVNGADGVVLFNRFYQPDIDINNMQIVSGNVFSNHSDLSDTIRWTAIVSGKIPGISIASSTGVHDWEDVVKCLLAGASAVQMCSAVYTHGAEIISQVLTCVEEWMHQAHYQSLSQFQGKLNYANIPNPAMYERSQFMKYFSNRD